MYWKDENKNTPGMAHLKTFEFDSLSMEGVLGIWAWRRRIAGGGESAELWRPNKF